MIWFISFVLSIGLFLVIFKREGFRLKHLKEGGIKVFYRILLVLASVLFFYKPVEFLFFLTDSNKTTIYQALFLKKWTQVMDGFFMDAFYDQEGKVCGLIYDGVKRKYKVRTYSQKGDVVQSDENDTETYWFDPHYHYTNGISSMHIRRGDFSYDGQGIYIKGVRQNWPILKETMGNFVALGEGTAYYVSEEKKQVVIKENDGLSEKVISDRRVMSFSPYYWEAAKALLYTTVVKDKEGYDTFINLKKGQDETLSKLFVHSSHLSISPLKFSGNSNGVLLSAVYTDRNQLGNKLSILNMEHYPFKQDKNATFEDIFGGMRYAFQIEFPRHPKIYSASFHPTIADRLLILATEKDSELPQIFEYQLLPATLSKYEYGAFDYVLLLGSLFLVGILIFLSIGVRRDLN